MRVVIDTNVLVSALKSSKGAAFALIAQLPSALLTQSYLEREAAKGRRQDFDKVLRAVPAVEPEPHDTLI